MWCGGELVLVAARGPSRSEIVLEQCGTRLELHRCSECGVLTPFVLVPTRESRRSLDDWMSGDAAKRELAALDPVTAEDGPEPPTPAGCCLLCCRKDSLIHLGSRRRGAVRLDLYRCIECEGLTALDSGEGDACEQHEALLEDLRSEIVAALYPA